ncbi:MAG: LysR family transcriptional regulator [Paracoccaceae bacterium]
MQDVDTALLRTFVVLAETGSFSRTGGLIGRSQSAVSGQIARLEASFGRALFARNTRNVALTAEGERLLAPARSLIAAADAMVERFATAEVAGEVRFGSPEDFASAYLPDILGVFAAAHPAVELHVTCQLTLPLVEAFEAGEHDLIVVKQDPGRPYSGARALWRERLVWVGVSALDFASDRALPLVLSPAPCVYRSRALGALEVTGREWTGVFTSPSFAGCAAAVRAGLGFAVMPEGMVPEGLVVQAGWPALAEAELALLGAVRLTPAAAALARFIGERVRR